MVERRQTFPKQVRLTGRDSFGHVIQKGGFAADGILVAHVLPNTLAYSRFGITIPKRTGNAVVRNRWKRHIRESLREIRIDVAQGCDFVIRPKKGAELDAKQIRRGMIKLLARAVKRLPS